MIGPDAISFPVWGEMSTECRELREQLTFGKVELSLIEHLCQLVLVQHRIGKSSRFANSSTQQGLGHRWRSACRDWTLVPGSGASSVAHFRCLP